MAMPLAKAKDGRPGRHAGVKEPVEKPGFPKPNRAWSEKLR